mgnify:FL=1
MIIRLKPLFKEKIWGGTRLKTLFDYEFSSMHTGEVWGVSAHINGSNEIMSGPSKGMKFRDFFQKNIARFNLEGSTDFPLLVKMIDAKDDLSIQVHPGDDYPNKPELNGKSECWYILDAVPDASIIFGHTAKTLDEFKRHVRSNNWADLIKEVPVGKGDFIFVPAGTIHAIKKGVVLLEIQQSSDTTFRVYDYNRTDSLGQKRPLHLEEAFQSIKIPDEQIPFIPPKKLQSSIEKLRFISNKFFTVERWHVNKRYQPFIDGFKIFMVLEGSGYMDHEPIKKGDHIVVLGDKEAFTIEGEMTLMVAWQ